MASCVGGVELAAGVGRERRLVGRREPRERVGGEHHTLGVAVRVEQRPHEDRNAAPPHAGLDQVSGHAVGEHALDTLLDVVETLRSHHRLREPRPVAAFGPDVGPVEVGLGELLLHGLPELLVLDVARVVPVHVERAVQHVCEGALDEIEVPAAQPRRFA